MTDPITLEEVRDYVGGFRAIKDIDPRTGIKPDALVDGLSNTIYNAMQRVVGREAVSHIRNGTAKTERSVIIGYYTPKDEKNSKGFCYSRGCSPTRIGIRRYDEQVDLSPVDVFALQTGGSVEITSTLSRAVYKKIIEKVFPYAFLKVFKAAEKVTPLRFTMPTKKQRKKRSKDAIYAERRGNMVSNLGAISWGARQHTYADFDFAEHFRKNQYHASLLKDDMGKYAAQELERLEERYNDVSDEVHKLIADYSREIADLERRLRLNQVP